MNLASWFITQQVQAASSALTAAISRLALCSTLLAVVQVTTIQVPPLARPLVRRESGRLRAAAARRVSELLLADLRQIQAAASLEEAQARKRRVGETWQVLRGHFPTELQRATAECDRLLATFRAHHSTSPAHQE